MSTPDAVTTAVEAAKSSDELKWGDPPIRRGKAGYRAALVERLKARPGEWAEIPVIREPRQFSSDLQRRYPEVESISRKVDGVVRVWARWVGVKP